MNGYPESPMCEDALIVNPSIGIDAKKKQKRVMRRDDLIGKRFGKLVVVSFERKDGYVSWWKCRCDCGNEKILQRGNIASGRTVSCGCKRSKTHGRSYTPEYLAWAGMIQRCTNPKAPHYYLYGKRGIMVCDRWINSFENFYADMGNRPSAEYSIERKNVDGNYELSNCTWATRFEQQRNTRVQKNNTTGVNGVGWFKKSNKYIAKIRVDRKTIYLGVFELLSDAAKARHEAEIKYWGRAYVRPSEILGIGKVSNAGLEE